MKIWIRREKKFWRGFSEDFSFHEFGTNSKNMTHAAVEFLEGRDGGEIHLEGMDMKVKKVIEV